MELKLLIRQLIRYDKSGTKEQYIKLQNSGLVTVMGSLPAHRRFPNYGHFLDVTDKVSDLHQLKLTWTLERNEQGMPSVGITNQKKSASGTLVFEGDAYKYLKAWLVDDESASVNAVEVEIKHEHCGDYKNWVIKATDLSWCEDEICTFNVSLKQKDEPFTCIKNTLITDDWQGWFGNTRRPSSGRKHPRFSYCNEMRPNGKLITIWWTITQLMSILGPLMLVLAPIVNSIVFTLKVIIYPIINFILGILGKKKLDKDKLNYIDYKDIKDIFGNFFIESAGCGREHPAPLIRDYIQNVCSKCGIAVNGGTVPVFFAQSITLETSADKYKGAAPQARANPHYNACYFHPTVEKGVRRFDDLNIFSGAVLNTTDWWLPGNAPLLTLDMFLDQLKTIYNSEWRVENNTLYFQRKDYWLNNKDAFDFSEKGKDRNLLVKGLCYEWDENKEPLYSKGVYDTDAADVCGNGAMGQMNGYVSFGNIDVNPQLDGLLDKTTKFGATKFRLDGADTDYVFDAMQQVINTTLITGSVWTTPLFATVNGFFRDYANYALLLTSETVTQPKILLWDGNRYENARCVMPYHASINLGGPAPNPNLKYNSNGLLWEHKHEPQTKVSGRKLVPPPQPFRLYEVRGLFGALVTLQSPKLVNYPMYFEPGYEGTLWDWFHWIDDPNENPKLHQRFTAQLELCCDTLKDINPFGDASNIILGQKIKLPGKFFNEGRITEIEISYDTDDDTGKHITLKGIR